MMGRSAIATEMGISRSELIEQIGRGLLKVVKAESECGDQEQHDFAKSGKKRAIALQILGEE